MHGVGALKNAVPLLAIPHIEPDANNQGTRDHEQNDDVGPQETVHAFVEVPEEHRRESLRQVGRAESDTEAVVDILLGQQEAECVVLDDPHAHLIQSITRLHQLRQKRRPLLLAQQKGNQSGLRHHEKDGDEY